MSLFEKEGHYQTRKQENFEQREQLIKAFEKVRDIPYKIPLSTKEQNFACNGKHRILKKKLDEMGVESRFRLCTFDWDEILDIYTLVEVRGEGIEVIGVDVLDGTNRGIERIEVGFGSGNDEIDFRD
ncbi:MAG: hypothetical protein GF335_01890 [Candidatus Moranbacteria bacterium]|nr:hypothetical protein [Candidatus Moranbacteria bacterium]